MNVIVVGGGPAGMMAAISAAENGHQVTLIEKNEKLGKKLFITGKGRCNFTNASDLKTLMEHIITNPKFLYSALYSFDNQAVMDFFELHGMDYKVERGMRVFPSSDHSSDVIRTLSDYMKMLGVTVLLNTELINLNIKDSKVLGVQTSKGSMTSDAVILALGGKSYPSCGANGDTWRILKNHNIKTSPAEPSLVPLTTSDEYVQALQGLSLKNVKLTIFDGNKVKYSDQGEMMFTHFGITGPLVLTASCYLKESDYSNNLIAEIDLKPALSEKQLDERLLRDFDEYKNKQFKNALNKLLPSKLIPIIIQLSNISAEKPVNSITKDERMNLISVLKHFALHVNGNRGFNEAIITRGGISTSEINPKTMELKKIKGLYVVGEMIDVDAHTGGYNLQIAWSTGHLCGESIEY